QGAGEPSPHAGAGRDDRAFPSRRGGDGGGDLERAHRRRDDDRDRRQHRARAAARSAAADHGCASALTQISAHAAYGAIPSGGRKMLDVLIVGAGPTGLVLALWLRKLGVEVRIVDKTAEPGTTSRALAVQARTLELY